MIRIWKLNLLIAFLTLLWLSGCLETEQTVPFDPGAFETSTPDEAVVISVAGDSFVQGEPIPYTIINRSTRRVHYETKDGICELPPTGVDTFLYVETTESGWKRVPLSAPNLALDDEALAIEELAAGTVVECSWDQLARQDLDLEGEERFRSMGTEAPVPPGYYQFHIRYDFDHDNFPAAEVSYSDIFEIQ